MLHERDEDSQYLRILRKAFNKLVSKIEHILFPRKYDYLDAAEDVNAQAEMLLTEEDLEEYDEEENTKEEEEKLSREIAELGNTFGEKIEEVRKELSSRGDRQAERVNKRIDRLTNQLNNLENLIRELLLKDNSEKA